jgi:2-polyprenyl-3-methyl-5-hydroxy-6-metoxy-1,4-benzoquinol methylase
MTAAERIRAARRFELHDIDLVASTLTRFELHGTPWDDFREAICVLPGWFRHGLDPLSREYAHQQERLWSAFSGVDRSYVPETDEQEIQLFDVDAIRRPGFFMRRDSEAVSMASDHLLATGMVLKHSGLKSGDWALEYGAGFGSIALTLARLGVFVDTVDISAAFCRYVKQQADFFEVPLNAFQGKFGWNPRPDKRYDLIFFFEAFHHCPDFLNVVRQMKQYLAPTGRILLSGEPLARSHEIYVPYPWGLKLDAISVAQMRRYHWFEMGFKQEFLIGVFVNAGYSARYAPCPQSGFGEIYYFQHRSSDIRLADEWLPDLLESGWNTREDAGRWTNGDARLFLDMSDSFDRLVVSATNHHPRTLKVEVGYAGSVKEVCFGPGEQKETVIAARDKGAEIRFRSPALIPARDYRFKRRDSRTLGLFVHSVSYR